MKQSIKWISLIDQLDELIIKKDDQNEYIIPTHTRLHTLLYIMITALTLNYDYNIKI